MSRFLLTIILALLVSCTTIEKLDTSARANTPETEQTPTPTVPIEPNFELSPNPFIVQKPTMCQRGDAFIAVLESRKEYRAFIGQGQLVREDATGIKVWVFTAVNFQTGTFTIFEWHDEQDISCILAIGQGFQILETESKAQNTIHIRDILTIDK